MINQVRLAQKSETVRLKEIWKLCFRDTDSYIDFYFANRYKEDETAVLLNDEEIVAMLTMITVKTMLPGNRSMNTAMLYAIATHPKYQNRGFAAQLMDLSNKYLRSLNIVLCVLVPATMQLFDFYRKQGYQDGFFIRETLLNRNKADSLPIHKSGHCTISSISPEEYNRRRNKQLSDTCFISYTNKDIAYQKMLSQKSGADIYVINIEEDKKGCLAVERISSDKMLIKEFLLPKEYMNIAIKQIVQQLSAKEYILRTPSYLGEHLGGSIRPFGLIRIPIGYEPVITPEDLGYLGFAFD